MPLLNHFHPPLYPARQWRSFLLAWCAGLAEQLNEGILPPDYFAEIRVKFGGRVECELGSSQTYAPAAPVKVMPTTFPDEVEVQVLGSPTGLYVVAAIELISPGNKDRPDARRMFASKCATY